MQALTGLCYDGVEGLIYLVLFSFVTALMFSSIVCSVPHTWQSKRWEGKGQNAPKNGRWVEEGKGMLNAAQARTSVHGQRIDCQSRVFNAFYFHICSFCFHFLIIFSWLCVASVVLSFIPHCVIDLENPLPCSMCETHLFCCALFVT